MRLGTIPRIPKLVVWDLDCTFWYGTLLEGGVREIPQNVELVHRLTRIGIINSVVSNTDFSLAKVALSRLGVWEELILPSIGFSSKGLRVKEIITAIGIRAEDVLFIDDQATNCADVIFNLPGVMTSTGDAIADLISYAWSVEPPPRAQTRIMSYRSIAARETERRTFEGSNEAFLRSAGIRVSIFQLTPQLFPQVIDLVNRSNQLNFTKSRLDFDYLNNVTNSGSKALCVAAEDNFGHHGIVGFVVLQNTEAIHYVFSCRVMNLGVEHFVYQYLGQPRIRIRELDTCVLESPQDLDWITYVDTLSAPREGGGVSVLAKGGCEIERLVHYLDCQLKIDIQLNYVNAAGFPVHLESIIALKERSSGKYDAISDLLCSFDFLDARMGVVDRVGDGFNFMILSLASDFSQGIFQSRRSGSVVPAFKWNDGFDAEDRQNLLVSKYRVDSNQASRFLGEFCFLGGSSPLLVQENLRWLTNESRIACHYIILNCAEVDDAPSQLKAEVSRTTVLNAAVDDALRNVGNVTLIDVRKIVKSFRQCEDNLRHFRPNVYMQIGEEISRAIACRTSVPAKYFTPLA